MNYLLFILFFILGATTVIIAWKMRLKSWGNTLSNKLEELKSDKNKTADSQNLPAELKAAIDKINSIIQQRKSEENKKTKPDAEQPDKSAQLQKTLDDLYIVNELGQNVTSSLNLQQTFHHLYSTINSLMDAAVLELRVLNESNNQWKLFSNIQKEDSNSDYTNHFADWSFKNNREIFLADAENDFQRYVFEPLKMPDGRMAKSVIIFPVLNKGAVSGTLCIISFRNNSFSEYHQVIIRLLLGYISVAIQNAITHEELNITKLRAENSEKFMQQFLANMSHEIRTPINAVTGMTRLLLEKNPRNEQLKYLESIRNASDSLLVIVNDILDLSKIEAGKVELEQIDYSVFDVVKGVREIMQFKAEEKGLTLSTKIEEDIPPVLIGDPTRLTQILINLLGNAVKFTEKGSVKLAVRQIPASRNNSHPDPSVTRCQLQFSVEDTGIGMTQEQQKKLFQNYAQASSDTARKFGGTGLGLSISKQLVQLQGGDIEVRSVPGEGSVFAFSISYQISKNKTVARKELTVSKEMLQKLKGLKVLLADDNDYNRIVARETLQLKIENVMVDEAIDGVMAVGMVEQNDYDVVLMDVVMPNMNGLEATETIRKDVTPPKNDIVILALTASVVKSEIDKCYAAGMNGFIPKPFKSHELFGGIYSALYGNSEASLEEVVVSNNTPTSSHNYFDLTYLYEFTEGDPARLQRYIDLFLSKTPVFISNLKNAIEKSDFEKVRISAHSMKPQLRFIGVTQGFELAETIEISCLEKRDMEKLPELIAKLSSVCELAMIELKTSLASK